MYFCRRNWSHTTSNPDQTPTGGAVVDGGVLPRGEAVFPEEPRLAVADFGGDGDPFGTDGLGFDADAAADAGLRVSPAGRFDAEHAVELAAVDAEKNAEVDGEGLDGAARTLDADFVLLGREDLAHSRGRGLVRAGDGRAGDERDDHALRRDAVERGEDAGVLLGVVLVAVVAAQLVGGERGALHGHVAPQLLPRHGLRLPRMAAERAAERDRRELSLEKGNVETSSKTLISARVLTWAMMSRRTRRSSS